jgi:ankyrin repeat protein
MYFHDETDEDRCEYDESELQAALKGDSEASRRLVARGCALRASGSELAEAAMCCVALDDASSLALLLANGLSADASGRGIPLISRAAHAGSEACAGLLIDAGASLDARCAPRGWTPIHYAAQHGSVAIAMLLWAAGSPFDEACLGRETPLALAVGNLDDTTAAMLLEMGADPNANARLPLLSLAISNVEDPDDADRAVRICSMLLARGALPDGDERKGRVPLGFLPFWADIGVSEERAAALAQLLIANGASAHLSYSRGERALHRFAACGWGSVCKLLILHGADPKALNAEGATASHMAGERGHADLAALLHAWGERESLDRACARVEPSRPAARL